MIEHLKITEYGFYEVTKIGHKHATMQMDIQLTRLKKGNTVHLYDSEKEMSLLLLSGKLEYQWHNQIVQAERNSLYNENPWCLHLSRNTTVTLNLLEDSELLIQSTLNSRPFAPVCYRPEMIRSDIFGKGIWNDTARRIVRTIIDYQNAPYSNLVIGEVITFPGKWSSYIPHHHPQPEVYLYKFDWPQGFGISVIGDAAYKVYDNSVSIINGGLVHPQVSAPGYAMYYCWMIRHLENNPWTERIDAEEHKWLLQNEVDIWSGPGNQAPA